MSEPHLQINFYFNGNQVVMEKVYDGHLDTSFGHHIINTQGGKGGMASSMSDLIHKAVRIFTQQRNFRVGSVVTHLKGGNKRTLKSIDYGAGTAKSESGKHIILSQMMTLEW